MRDYATLRTVMWAGKTMKLLRGDPVAQLLVPYLISSPHSNMIGVYHCPVAYMADDLGTSSEGARKGLARVCEAGFCTYDDELDWVFVHRMAEIQVGAQLKEADKRVPAVAREFNGIASAPLKAAFYALYKEALHLPLHAADKRGSIAPTKPLRSQEHEHEHEHDQDHDHESEHEHIGGTPPKTPSAGAQVDPAGAPIKVKAIRKPAIEYADPAFVPPDWIPIEPWKAYEEMRRIKNAKAPYTATAQKLVVAKLDRLRQEGQDVGEVLSNAAIGGWTNVYATRSETTQGGPRPGSAGRYTAAAAAIFDASNGDIVDAQARPAFTPNGAGARTFANAAGALAKLKELDRQEKAARAASAVSP